MDNDWGKLGKQTSKAMQELAEKGINPFNEKQLKRIGLPIIREAKKRMRELEINGLTDSPAYRYIKRNNINFTTSADNLNELRKNVWAAHKFLTKPTSNKVGAESFLNKTVNKWTGRDTTKEQREKIWDLFYRLEDKHPGYFTKETYGSGELSADIYLISEVLNSKDWNIDEAYEVLSRDEMLIFDDDIDFDLMDEVTDWYTRIR